MMRKSFLPKLFFLALFAALTAAVLTPSPAKAETWQFSDIVNGGVSVGAPITQAIDTNTIFVSYDYTPPASSTRRVNLAKSANGGSTWSIVPDIAFHGTGNVGYSMHAADANTIFIAYYGYSGSAALLLRKSIDGGLNWTTYIIDNTIKLKNGVDYWVSIYAVDINNVFVTYSDLVNSTDTSPNRTKFAKSTDGGINWSAPVIMKSNVYSGTKRIEAIDLNTIFVSVYDGKGAFFKSTNGGSNWSEYQITATSTYDILMDAVDSNAVFASGISTSPGYKLQFFKSTNGGQTWSNLIVDNVTSAYFPSIRAIDVSTIFLSYYDQINGNIRFAKSTDGGSNWSDMFVDINNTCPGWILGTNSINAIGSDVLISYEGYQLGGCGSGQIFLRFAKAASSPPPPLPTVNLSAFPTTINSGESTTLSWTTTDATSCDDVPLPEWLAGPVGVAGSEVEWPTATTTYTISCTGPGGTTQQSTTVTVNATCGEGSLNWSQPYTGAGANSDYGYGVAVDSSNNIYITGRHVTAASADDMFLRKYDSSGNFQWMQTYSGSGLITEQGRDVAVDLSGNIYVTGYQQPNSTDMFLRKYDSTGAPQWTQTYHSGGSGQDYGYGVAVDSGGNIYVTGYQGVPAFPGYDAFLRKYDSSGNFQWMQTYDTGLGTNEYGRGIAIDPASGNIYIVGQQPQNGNDMFLQKYDSTGALQWTRTYNSGGTQYDRGEDVVVDTGGNIYVTGYQATNTYDMFLRKYDSSGNFQWMQTYNSSGAQADYGYGVAVDSGGNAYVTGQQETNGDIFLQKYNSSGALQWTQVYNSGLGGTTDAGYDVVVDSGNNIDVSGSQLDVLTSDDVVLLQYDGSGCSFIPAPAVTLWANPSTINSGNSSTLYWNATDATSCAAVSPAGWTAKTTISDSQYIPNITATTIYRIVCTGPGGTTYQATTVTVNAPPAGADCGLRMFDGTSTIILDCETPASSTPLRIYKDTTTYGIKLVDPADANASRFRIQTPAGTKALKKQ